MTIVIATSGWPVVITLPLWCLGVFGTFAAVVLVSGIVCRSAAVAGAGYALGLLALLIQAGLSLASRTGWRIGMDVAFLIIYVCGLFWFRYLRSLHRKRGLDKTRALGKVQS